MITSIIPASLKVEQNLPEGEIAIELTGAFELKLIIGLPFLSSNSSIIFPHEYTKRLLNFSFFMI